MRNSRTLIAAVAVLIPLGAAVAGEGPKDKSGMASASFDKLDANRDGRISQAEAVADTTIVFTSADANGDGYLDQSEWRAQQKGTSSPAPQSAVEPATDPMAPPSSDPAPADTEMPRQ